jgi:hypothetical protein
VQGFVDNQDRWRFDNKCGVEVRERERGKKDLVLRVYNKCGEIS